MSELAKKVAGTFIPDSVSKLGTTLAWVTEECRSGRFAETIKAFCEAQSEYVDPKLTLVERVTDDAVYGRLPCRCFDHESDKTFPAEVKFSLNPATGQVLRLS